MKRILSFILLFTLASAVSFAQHSDLKAYGLKGKVKRISTSDREGVAFDKNGKIFSIRIPSILAGGGSVYGKKINHKNNRISSVSYPGEWEGAIGTTVTYKYNTAGYLASTELSGHEWWNNYYYSNYKNGLPYTVKLDVGGEAHSEEGTCKITYTKFDSHGNWTQCRWDGTLRITDDGGDTYHNEKYSHTIKREIFYY